MSKKGITNSILTILMFIVMAFVVLDCQADAGGHEWITIHFLQQPPLDPDSAKPWSWIDYWIYSGAGHQQKNTMTTKVNV